MPYGSGYPDTVTNRPPNLFREYRFFRLLLILTFLISIQVVFTFWSQVGGQSHLDLMFWPWKFGLSLFAAALITGIAEQLIRAEGPSARRLVALWTLLAATVIVGGLVTYYYHVNEPQDEEDDTAQSYQT